MPGYWTRVQATFSEALKKSANEEEEKASNTDGS